MKIWVLFVFRFVWSLEKKKRKESNKQKNIEFINPYTHKKDAKKIKSNYSEILINKKRKRKKKLLGDLGGKPEKTRARKLKPRIV